MAVALENLVPILNTGSMVLLVIAIGLDAPVRALGWLLRRPRKLISALTAMHIVVPLAAGLVVAWAPLAPVVKAAIVAMAVSPVPPAGAGRGLQAGADKAYAYGLFVAASLAAIVIVPLSLLVFSLIFPADAWLSPLLVAHLVLTTVLAPLGIGMGVRWLAPALADQMARILWPAAMALLGLALLLIAALTWRSMAELAGDGTLLAMLAVALAGIVAGRLLGGPDPGRRAALSIASAARHPGLAALIVEFNWPYLRGGAAVLMFLIVSELTIAAYGFWIRRAVPKAVAA